MLQWSSEKSKRNKRDKMTKYGANVFDKLHYDFGHQLFLSLALILIWIVIISLKLKVSERNKKN